MATPKRKVSEVRQTPSLSRRYLEVRQASTSLAQPLEPEDCVVQTIPEVSPTKWHLAHVSWFFEKFCLEMHSPGYQRFDDQYHYLFNSYYYTVGDMYSRPRRGLLSRPTLREILEYREHVDSAMTELIESNADNGELEFLVSLGLNHEQQHQELMLTDIKHVFFTNPIGPVYGAAPGGHASKAVDFDFIDRPGGRFAIGASGDAFCFDNETPRHEVLVGDHSLGNRLVTNGEYRQFIEDGGYTKPALWLSDGWSTVCSAQWSRPLYWSEDRQAEFTLSGWRAIEDESPVCHVSLYEADAFARWAGARLPLEAEWELAAEGTRVAGNTLDERAWHPRAPAAAARDDGGLYQLWGDVWEWTSSPYSPYPRFEPLAGSLGEYNGKFMANQVVVRGGSCASWASHLRASYRSFFYPQDRWQFLGIRLARDL